MSWLSLLVIAVLWLLGLMAALAIVGVNRDEDRGIARMQDDSLPRNGQLALDFDPTSIIDSRA